MLSIPIQSPQSHNIPLLPPVLVDIVNDYYLEEPTSNIYIYSSPCERVLNTLYDTKFRYYSTLELYRVMCGTMPKILPQPLIDAEAAMRALQSETEQRADWTVIRSLRDFYFISPISELPNIGADTPQRCACRHVSSYVAHIEPMILQAERFVQFRDYGFGFCPVSLTQIPQQLLPPRIQDLALLKSLNDLDTSIHLTNAQHPETVPTLSRLQTLKQRIIHCAKSVLSLVAIGSMVLSTALKITLLVSLNVIFCGSLISAQSFLMIFLAKITHILTCGDISIPGTFILSMSLVGGTAIGIYASIPYLKRLWKARQSIFQLHMECLPACHRLWKDYTKTFGILKGSCRLMSDFLWKRSNVPSVVVRR